MINNRILAFIILAITMATCRDSLNTKVISIEDGPYILQKGDSIIVIAPKMNNSYDSIFIAKTDLENIEFVCQFDSLKCPPLCFKLHPNFTDSFDTFAMPNKLLALSDIEGNFEKFYGLLLANNVIDSSYNWMFGKGHLVIIGDLVDRGKYVTQCLWLTYKLEYEANKHGGKVHYILGNHEQLILMGYDNYCAHKYLTIFKDLKTDISNLYSKKSELGKWMRNKNAMVKIGDILFVHAGISPTITQYNLTIKNVNAEVRKNIDIPEYETDESMALLTEEGILWYRGLIEDGTDYAKTNEKDLDKVLEKFNSKSIVIGHTPVDNISTDFSNKVIRIDVDHYENSSALYIEMGNRYITDTKGNKIKI